VEGATGATRQGRVGHAYSVGKSSGHPLVGALHAEYADGGLRAFNVEPGFVATERNEIVVRDFGHDIVDGAPPAAIGAVVAWLLTSRDADALAGTTVDAQATCLDRRLFGAWR